MLITWTSDQVDDHSAVWLESLLMSNPVASTLVCRTLVLSAGSFLRKHGLQWFVHLIISQPALSIRPTEMRQIGELASNYTQQICSPLRVCHPHLAPWMLHVKGWLKGWLFLFSLSILSVWILKWSLFCESTCWTSNKQSEAQVQSKPVRRTKHNQTLYFQRIIEHQKLLKQFIIDCVEYNQKSQHCRLLHELTFRLCIPFNISGSSFVTPSSHSSRLRLALFNGITRIYFSLLWSFSLFIAAVCLLASPSRRETPAFLRPLFVRRELSGKFRIPSQWAMLWRSRLLSSRSREPDCCHAQTSGRSV